MRYIASFLKSLILDSQELRGRTKYAHFQRNRQFLNEFATIKISGPRSSGHTTAMIKASQMFKNPAFIIRTEEQAYHVKRCFSVDLQRIEDNVFCTTKRMLGRRFDAIFVDCATFFPKEEMARIGILAESCLGSNPNKFVLVLLQ